MEPQDTNAAESSGQADRDCLGDLLRDYGCCSDRHRAQIRRFAHKLAELDVPAPLHSATILPFPR